MVAWQTRQRALIDLGQPTDQNIGHTLSDDIARYLALLPAGRTRDDAEDLLAHWGRVYGHQPRHALTAPILHAQLLAWHRDGAAPQTCNHRRRVLVTLTTTLDGPDAANFPRACPKLPVPRPEPRGLPWATIAALLDTMRPSATKTRLQVIAHTGLPHATLARIQPQDLHLDGPRPYAVIRPRRKGAGVAARAVPLTADGAAALAAFAREGLCGKPFSNSSMHKAFTLAAQKVGAPAGVRPYDLRHSYAVRLYAATRDVQAVAALMLHSSLTTTARYAAQAVAPNAQAAVDALGATGATRNQRRKGRKVARKSGTAKTPDRRKPR